MPKSQYVDFKSVKTSVTMEQVLQHYGLREQMKGSSDSLSGCCPIHGGTNPTQIIGIMDSVLVHPREVFRTAIAANASALVLMHNHPSGEAQPSEADIRVTRYLIRAGQVLKLEVIDHVIVGNPGHCSLRALGYVS